jgi:hypothetical protein
VYPPNEIIYLEEYLGSRYLSLSGNGWILPAKNNPLSFHPTHDFQNSIDSYFECIKVVVGMPMKSRWDGLDDNKKAPNLTQQNKSSP